MLRFKQFLIEGVVDQIQLTQKRARLLAPELVKMNQNINYRFGGIDTGVFVGPRNLETRGTYAFIPKGKEFTDGTKNPLDFHRIGINTDDIKNISIPISQENSTLRHELQHLWQKARQLATNPAYALSTKNSKKFDNVVGVDLGADNYLNKWGIKKELSYNLDPQEVNARGIQRGGDAIERHNALVRSRIISDPKFANFERELEKSKGAALAPDLDPQTARIEADAAFKYEIDKEIDNLKSLEKDLQFVKAKDAKRALKDIKTTKKTIASDIARALQSNVDYAQQVAQDAYSEKVIGPQRERQIRVAQMKNDFDVTRPMGFNSGVFMSDPISNSNFAYDVAGAMGDVTTRDQTMKKAAASLYNPMYSDSEQMMGDAFLRGSGEDFAVDPTFLQMANQRKKDRQK